MTGNARRGRKRKRINCLKRREKGRKTKRELLVRTENKGGQE